MSTTAPPDLKSGNVVPAGCGCGRAPGAPVYALGALGFDFGTRERRDAFTAANDGRPIITNADLFQYLSSSPIATADFESILWTLTLDGAPVYALRSGPRYPMGDWGMLAVVLGILGDPTIERIAVPGTLSDATTTLIDGRVLPVIDPDVRGIQSWSTPAIAAAVAIAGTAALPPAAVNLTTEGTSGWRSWDSLPPVEKTSGGMISALGTVVSGWAGLITPYAGSTLDCTWDSGDGTSPPAAAGGFSGAAVSALGGGLQFTLPASATPSTLRIYARTFGCAGAIVVTVSDGSVPALVDTSFSAFPAVAGLPGVVDGVYRLTVQNQPSAAITVQLIGTPSPVVSPSPLTVTLYQGGGGAGASQALGVGVWPASAMTLSSLGSVHVPPGLRLSILNDASTALAFTSNAPAAPYTNVPASFSAPGQSLVVEAENYVGIQAVTLQPVSEAPVPLGAFMDRVYYLLRNAGVSSEERAINYAATRAVQRGEVAAVLGAGLILESIGAEPSPITRPGADCWDVKLAFVSPIQVTQAGRTIVRLTVDVAAVRPILISPPRVWVQH